MTSPLMALCIIYILKHFRTVVLTSFYTFAPLFLHHCTFKTPALRAVMIGMERLLCAFEMRKGVKVEVDYIWLHLSQRWN